MDSQGDLLGDSQPAETTAAPDEDAVHPPAPLQPSWDPEATVVRDRARADGEQGAAKSSTCCKMLFATCVSCVIVLASGITVVSWYGLVGDPRELLQQLAGKKGGHDVAIGILPKVYSQGIISKVGVPQAYTPDEEDQIPTHSPTPLEISSAANVSFSNGDLMLASNSTEELAPYSALGANIHDVQNVSTTESDLHIYANASFHDGDLRLAIHSTEELAPYSALEAHVHDLRNASTTGGTLHIHVNASFSDGDSMVTAPEELENGSALIIDIKQLLNVSTTEGSQVK